MAARGGGGGGMAARGGGCGGVGRDICGVGGWATAVGNCFGSVVVVAPPPVGLPLCSRMSGATLPPGAVTLSLGVVAALPGPTLVPGVVAAGLTLPPGTVAALPGLTTHDLAATQPRLACPDAPQ